MAWIGWSFAWRAISRSLVPINRLSARTRSRAKTSWRTTWEESLLGGRESRRRAGAEWLDLHHADGVLRDLGTGIEGGVLAELGEAERRRCGHGRRLRVADARGMERSRRLTV